MFALLLTLLILDALLLSVVVLLQAGQGGGLASLGGAFLVYTGFALSWRRFFPGRRSRVAPESSTASVEPETAA